MDSIKKFQQSLERFLKKPKDTKNQQLVNGWYQSYEALEKYAFHGTDKEQLRKHLSQGLSAGMTRSKSYQIWGASSAVFLLVSGLAFWLSWSQPKTRPMVYLSSVTETGTMKYLVLSDSSEIWLNASSQLRYPTSFSKKSRTVYLPQGEAFFQVKHDVNRPFKVYAGKLEVGVLGTSFNINNYSDLQSQTIVVNTGTVRISHGSKVLAVLEKGKQFRYDKITKAFKVTDVDQTLSYSWRDGKTILQDASFSAVAAVFKNWYGVELKSKIADINNYSYTLTIQRQISLDDNLALISKMHHINYRKEGNMIVFY